MVDIRTRKSTIRNARLSQIAMGSTGNNDQQSFIMKATQPSTTQKAKGQKIVLHQVLNLKIITPCVKPKKPLKSSLSKSPKISTKSTSRGGSSSSSDDDDVVMAKPRHVSGVQSRITAKSLRNMKSSIKRSVDVDYGGGGGGTSVTTGFDNPSFIPHERTIVEDDVFEKNETISSPTVSMAENILSDDSRYYWTKEQPAELYFKNISRQNRQWQWQANKFEHGQQYAGAKSKEKSAESSKSTKGRLWKDAESAKENKETQGATKNGECHVVELARVDACFAAFDARKWWCWHGRYWLQVKYQSFLQMFFFLNEHSTQHDMRTKSNNIRQVSPPPPRTSMKRMPAIELEDIDAYDV